MNIRKILSLGSKTENIPKTPLPYWLVTSDLGGKSQEDDRKMVIFFGNDAGSIRSMISGDFSDYIALTNKCLDFVCRKCSGLELYYKPHPANKEEQNLLDLKDFKIIENAETAEVFLWKKWGKIKHVFAIESWSAVSAAAMGLSSFLFYDLFRPIFGSFFSGALDDYTFEIPNLMRIKDLGMELPTKIVKSGKNSKFISEVRNLMLSNSGEIWVSVSNTEFAVALLVLAETIKLIDPQRRTHLLISRHHRWDAVDNSIFNEFFGEVIFLPRVFYSSHPRKIFAALRLYRRIKKLPVKPGDLIFSFSQVDFLENCLISAFSDVKRVGLIMARDFYMHYVAGNNTFTMNNDFRFTASSWFYNHIFEPIIGLYRTVFAFYGLGTGFFIMIYQRPVSEVFDRVYAISVSEKSGSSETI